MDEVEYDVTQARQKTTKVGAFRINPDGTQERRKVAEKEITSQCIIADVGNYEPFIQTAVGLNLVTFLLFGVSALNCF